MLIGCSRPLSYKPGDCLMFKATSSSIPDYYSIIGVKDNKYVVISTIYSSFVNGGRWETNILLPHIFSKHLIENDFTYKVDCAIITTISLPAPPSIFGEPALYSCKKHYSKCSKIEKN